MNFLEKDLEEIIYTASKELLAQRGLFIKGKLLRQLRIGNYGVADLVEFKRPYFDLDCNHCFKGEITVYELKKERISISTFLQAVNYVQGLRRYLTTKNVIDKYNFKIILIGKEIDLFSSFVYLPDLFCQDSSMVSFQKESVFNLELFTYNYDVDGISFNERKGVCLKNEGF